MLTKTYFDSELNSLYSKNYFAYSLELLEEINCFQASLTKINCSDQTNFRLIQNLAFIKETFLMGFNSMLQAIKNIFIITLIAFILIIYSFNLIPLLAAAYFKIPMNFT